MPDVTPARRLILAIEEEPDGIGQQQPCAVTPQMVAAGLDVYFQFDDAAGDPAELVRDIYLAMLAAQG